ncbi:MAG: tetratricopeptide repeat protein [Anaerolineales bacterium]
MRLRLLTLVLVVSNLIISSCTQKEVKELMPVTTTSDLAREFYETAITALDRLNYSTAWDNFQWAIKEDPDFFMANFWLYYISSQESKNVAERILQSDVELNNAEKEIKTAFKYLLEGQYEKTVAYLQKAIELYPYDPQLYKILYMLQLQFMNDAEASIATIEKAIDACPDFPMAYNFLGYAQLDLKNYDEAEKAFDEYIRLAPDQANPYDSKGDYFMEIKRYEEAYESYMKAFEIDSSFAISRKKADKAKQLMDKEDT